MSTQQPNLLIVEDDPGIQSQLKWSLEGFELTLVDNRESAINKVRLLEPVIVLLDLGLPPDPGGATEGLQTLKEILEIAPMTKVIVITGNEDREHAIEAVALGAYDFYNKPIDADVLTHVVERARRLSSLEKDNQRLMQTSNTSPLDGIIAVSEPMVRVCREIEKLAPSNISTLLLGESGTGKELLARALHALSPRASGSLVAINCAAIPENLLESELFGYEKGAFTGAAKQTRGKLEYAHKGTLFLDEIGDLPMPLQAKLLRFLQEKVIERVGGRTEIAVDARVISATHKDPQTLITEKLFREDLYYRLGEVTVTIPPLRDRETDVQVLAKFLLGKFCKDMGIPVKRFSDSALVAMNNHEWPGNVREMENKIKRACVMTEGKLVSAEDLSLGDVDSATISLNLREVREHAEKNAILQAMVLVDGNVSKAAKLLGVSRPTLYDVMNRHGIAPKK